MSSVSYEEWLLAPGVEVWHSTGSVGVQRILPDGCLDLLFDGELLLVAGPDTLARVHESASPRPLTAVRLHAGRGPALLGVPADELGNRTTELADLWGARRARDLTERVAEGPSRELAVWATTGPPVDPLGDRLRALLAGGGSVAEAADALGYSTRQLHRRALPVFGYGPAHLARVLRLLRAVTDADRGTDWATTAHRAGYADQAHLARDVRALAGVTPTALRRERGVRFVQDAA